MRMITGGLLHSNCCCGLDCSTIACSWHPCRWDIAFEGGANHWKYRQIFSDFTDCDLCPTCDFQCNGAGVISDTPTLMTCAWFTATVTGLSGTACLQGTPANCVCYWNSPGAGNWNSTHSSHYCSTVPEEQWVFATVTIQRRVSVFRRWCGTGGCVVQSVGSINDTMAVTYPYQIKAFCNPLLGNFGQQYTDGRVLFSAVPINLSNVLYPGGSSQFSITAHNARPYMFGDTVLGNSAWSNILNSTLGSTYTPPLFYTWAYPQDPDTTGSLSPLQIPASAGEWVWGAEQEVSGKPWGAGAETEVCTLAYIDPSELINTVGASNATYGAMRWTSREVYVPEVSVGGP